VFAVRHWPPSLHAVDPISGAFGLRNAPLRPGVGFQRGVTFATLLQLLQSLRLHVRQN